MAIFKSNEMIDCEMVDGEMVDCEMMNLLVNDMKTKMKK